MANVYIDSAAAGAGTGADWANAYTTVTAAIAGSGVAGNDYWIASSHAESTAGAVTLTSPGTFASPCRFISVNKAGSVPPVAADVLAGASVTTTGANAITIAGTAQYYKGVIFSAASGAVAANLNINNTAPSRGTFDSCDFVLAGTAGGSIVINGSGGRSSTVISACRYKFASTSSRIVFQPGDVKILGGSFISGGTTPTSLFSTTAANALNYNLIDGVDFSNLTNTFNLVLGGASTLTGKIIFRNCKLPSSWSGAFLSAALTNPGFRVESYNTDDDTNAQSRLSVTDSNGSIIDERTIVLSGGASDGALYSWNMSTTSLAQFPLLPLISPELFYWNTDTNVSKTLTVEVIHSGVGAGTAGALTDKQMWLSVEYLGATTSPLASFQQDVAGAVSGSAAFNPLTTAADQASSTATWNSSPATPVKQKLSVTFTPQKAGMYIATVYMTVPSVTVYVDPKLTIT